MVMMWWNRRVERYVRRSGDAYPYPSGLSVSDDEDVWPRELRQMGGLRLVGARPGGVLLVGVGLGVLPSPRWCPARYGLFHQKKDMSVKWLRLVEAWTMLGKCVDGVDLSDVAWRRRLKMTIVRARRC